MIELLADLLFALEAVEKERIASISGWGILMATDAVVAQVGGAEDGGHAAAGNEAFDAVVVELIAGME